jgi:hypothetical protein
MTLQSLTGRLEKLEHLLGDDRHPDHFVHYTYGYGDDEAAARDAAEARYRATHHVKPDDKIGFIALRMVSPDDPHEWIWGHDRDTGGAIHTGVPRAIDRAATQ